jgi:hypothetical protein
MTSSYSTDLKLELMVTGENAGTWGDNTNNNLNLIQQAIAGFETVTLSSGGTLALAMTDKTISNARNMVIKFATASIAASTICTIPDSIEKFYIFDATGLTNPTNLTIKTASGTGFTLDAAKIYAAYSDGTNLNEVSLDTLGGTVAAAQIADSAVTTAKIADDAVTSAKIADDAVVAAAIADNAVVTAAINNDAVTADKLADTSVSAGSYTTANITVDAQGRLTAAASGAGGDGSYVPRILAQGPVSTNYASPANASKFYAYAIGGGGAGAGGSSRNPAAYGGDGGKGACGFYSGAAQASTTYAYEIGAGGAANPASGSNFGGDGADGGQTKVTNLFTCDGGPGGNGPGTGNSPGQQQPDQPATNATIEFPREVYGFNPVAGKGGTGGSPGPYPSRVGNAGEVGFLHYFDDGGQ